MAPAPQFERFASSRWGVVAVCAVALLLYLPSIGNRYAMDDEPIAEATSVLRSGPDPVITAHFDATKWDYFTKFFRHHYWWPESHNDGLYRPIAVMSYGLVYQAVGRWLDAEDDAIPQHAVNVLLHTWAVWLAFCLVAGAGGSRVVAWLTALLFAVHAIHSEVVAGIVGRAEMFSFCFGAQAVLLLTRGRWWRACLAALLLFFAYGSKESSFCWIPFFFCLQWVRGRTEIEGSESGTPGMLRDPRTWLAVVAFAVPAVLWFLLRQNAMALDPPLPDPADPSSNPLGHETTVVRILTAVKVWGYGLWLCVAPFKLSCIYSPLVFKMVESPLDPGFLAAATALLGFLGAGLFYSRRIPLLFLAMACCLGFSFVTSNVPLAIGTIFGERLYYTPSLGICLLVALLWPTLRGYGRVVFAVVVASWCLANAAVAWQRTETWHDSGSVFLHDVEVYPMAIDLHRKAAASYASDGPIKDLDKAIAHLETARQLYPDYAHAYRELGKIYMQKQEWEKAIPNFERALTVDYPEPAGSESIALSSIGDCYVAMARAAPTEAEKRAKAATAATWYEKSLAAPKWGDKDGEAFNKLGDLQMFLSELETDAERRRAKIRAAIGYYEKTLALGDHRQMSATVALRRIFKHAVDPEILLPRKEFERLYDVVRRANLQDPDLMLLMGAMAYKTKMPPQLVLVPLQIAFRVTPEDQRTESFYRSHLFYADVLIEIGRVAEGRAVLQMLLGRPEIDAGLKAKIRARLGGGK